MLENHIRRIRASIAKKARTGTMVLGLLSSIAVATAADGILVRSELNSVPTNIQGVNLSLNVKLQPTEVPKANGIFLYDALGGSEYRYVLHVALDYVDEEITAIESGNMVSGLSCASFLRCIRNNHSANTIAPATNTNRGSIDEFLKLVSVDWFPIVALGG